MLKELTLVERTWNESLQSFSLTFETLEFLDYFSQIEELLENKSKYYVCQSLLKKLHFVVICQFTSASDCN